MKQNNDIRYQPLYSISEASRYLYANNQVLRTWLTGPSSGRGVPVIEPATREDVDKLSFVNLIEAHMLVALRTTHKISLQKIRAATTWLKTKTGSQHPLAEFPIQTDGNFIFVDYLDQLISANEKGQVYIRHVIERFLNRIERDSKGIPVSFYPFTRGIDTDSPKDIIMTPEIAFGRPVIKGTRISVQILAERFAAGDSVSTLANDYNLNQTLVEEAVRCDKAA